MKSFNINLFKVEGGFDAFSSYYGFNSLDEVKNPTEFSIALVGKELFCVIDSEWKKIIDIISPEEAKFVICDHDCLFSHFEGIKEKFSITTENLENGMIAITSTSGYIYVNGSWKKMVKFDIIDIDDIEIPEKPEDFKPEDDEIVENQVTITEIPVTNEVTYDGSVTRYVVIDPKEQIAVRPDIKFNIKFENLKNFELYYIVVNCPDTMYSIDGTDADKFSLTAGGTDFTNALYRITKIAGSVYIELLEFTSLS